MHEKNKREMVYVEKKIPSIFLLPWFESSGPVPLYPIESGANETTFAFEPLVVFEKREEEKNMLFWDRSQILKCTRGSKRRANRGQKVNFYVFSWLLGQIIYIYESNVIDYFEKLHFDDM